MLTIKRGDTPTVRWRVVDEKGLPVDLTNATARLHLQQGSRAPMNIPLTIVAPATNGQVEHTFTGTLAPGPWQYEIEFVRAGVTLTAPTSGTYRLQVEADIA